MFDITKIGDSIHVHRKRAGLTQRKLGELARIGCSNISAYENGKIPCLYNAIAIADALQVSLDDLIGRVVMDRPTLTPPNEWVSVEDAVPDPGARVLAANGNFVGEAYMASNGAWMRHDGFPWEVDAWMPMPDRRPPEGEEDT